MTQAGIVRTGGAENALHDIDRGDSRRPDSRAGRAREEPAELVSFAHEAHAPDGQMGLERSALLFHSDARERILHSPGQSRQFGLTH